MIDPSQALQLPKKPIWAGRHDRQNIFWSKGSRYGTT